MNVKFSVKFFFLVVAVAVQLCFSKSLFAQDFWSMYEETGESASASKVEGIKEPADPVSGAKPAGGAGETPSSSFSEMAPDFFSAFETPVSGEAEDTETAPSPESEAPVTESKPDKEFKRSMFSLVPATGVCLMQSPFTGGCNVGVDFYLNQLIAPFYFGGGIRCDFGFADDDKYPYTYYVDGEESKNPMLVKGLLYAPAGITFRPFNNWIRFLVGVRLGLALERLVSTDTAAKSRLHPALYTAVCAGVLLGDFEANVYAEYDGVGKFSHGLQFAYRIPIINLK